VLAEYKATDNLSVLGGFHRGWMMFEDNNNCLDFMGGLRWTSHNKKASLSYAVSVGPQDVAGVQDRFVHTALLKWQASESLQYIMQQDYGMENNATDGRTNVGDAAWYGLNQYLLYTLNPCWKAVARFEWFRDDDGVRVFGPPPAAGIRAWPGAPGFAGNFYELTLGLNWTPGTNLIVRPELRWDWYEGQSSIAGQRPFGSFDSDNQFLFGVDAIVTY
jgi:maltoporin